MSLFSRDGMLTGTEIERRVKKGHIQITPYDPKCVNPNSYNLKLHPQLLIYKRDAERANITSKKEIVSIDDIMKFRSDTGIAFGTTSEHVAHDEPVFNLRNDEEKHESCSIDIDDESIRIINRNNVNKAIDIKVTRLHDIVDEKIKDIETKWSSAFNQLGGTVVHNDNKSRERDEEIKSLPIVESNYLPPLDMHKKNETIEFQIPEEGYVLQPGVLYIGRTVERTATDKFIPMINGRSSGGRLGISIHICAGFGDIGFDGTWTLEITVVEPVRIYPNEEIAQVCFFTPAGKKAKLYRGRYYKQEDATASRFHQPKKEY